jgi:hypothetical protein
MPWNKTPDVAMYKGADWNGLVNIVPGCTPQTAMRIALKDPTITFFFYCRESMYLEPTGGNPGRFFNAGDAVFFNGSSQLWPGSAPQCDTYQRQGMTIAYINPQSVSQFLSLGSYTTSWGTPAIDVAILFAGNYAADTLPYLRANNNDPPTSQPFDQNIQTVLDSGAISTLQSLGLTVMVSITNGHSQVGWSEFTSQADAQRFASYLASDVVGPYGLDGIDIDDEYSDGVPQDSSLAMVTTLMRSTMPNLLISKVVDSTEYLSNSWNGHTLASNLTYCWNMSYGLPAEDALPPYVPAGVAANTLSMGFWSGSPSPDPTADVNWIVANGYAGVMVFAFETTDNVTLMGTLVDALLGPGNWNQSAAVS